MTSCACVSIERWPESISIVVAFMRLARKRSSSGEVVRSCRETAYQHGFDRHAATVTLREKGFRDAALHCVEGASLDWVDAVCEVGEKRVLCQPANLPPFSSHAPILARVRCSRHVTNPPLSSVITVPANEWPARIVEPSCIAKMRRVCATSSASEPSGFCTAVAFRPAVCNRAITSDQDEPSAYAPWTSTTLRTFPLVDALISLDRS